MANANDTVIELRHLAKSFGDHEVLRDINVSVRRGEVISVIGSSGCTHELFDYTRYRQTAVGSGVMQETCVTVT